MWLHEAILPPPAFDGAGSNRCSMDNTLVCRGESVISHPAAWKTSLLSVREAAFVRTAEAAEAEAPAKAELDT